VAGGTDQQFALVRHHGDVNNQTVHTGHLVPCSGQESAKWSQMPTSWAGLLTKAGAGR
jgi:hypothetical protein